MDTHRNLLTQLKHVMDGKTEAQETGIEIQSCNSGEISFLI